MADDDISQVFARLMVDVSKTLDEVVKVAIVSERLKRAVIAVGASLEAISDALEFDSDLQPELRVAAEGLQETMEALVRARDFALVRCDVAMEKMKDTGSNEEGEGHA